jgi:DNA-directed RNA polymerase specialized sigma24 family protein
MPLLHSQITTVRGQNALPTIVEKVPLRHTPAKQAEVTSSSQHESQAMSELFADQFPTLKECEDFWKKSCTVALYITFRILQDHNDAEDVVSEAREVLWMRDQSRIPIKLEKGTFEASLRAYFFKIVRSRAIDIVRRRRLLPAVVEEMHRDREPIPSLEKEVMERSLPDKARDFIATLPPALQRHFFVLCEYGNDWEAYARSQGLVPTIQVRNRFYNATRRLRTALQEAGLYAVKVFCKLLRGEE